MNNVLNGNNLLDEVKLIQSKSKISIISVGSHSPAYQFSDLPEPDAIFKQENAESVCFWLKFDWHVMFAKAISESNDNLGFICVRPDERAKELIGWKIRNNLITIHCPSKMIKRLGGADCIEESKSLLEYLKEIYKEVPKTLMIIMAPGSKFGRKLIKKVNIFVPNGYLMAHALGDTPLLISIKKLKELLFNLKIRDKLRFIKHLYIRIFNQRIEKSLYKNLYFLWVPTEESRKHWKEFTNCQIVLTSGGYDANVWQPAEDKIKLRELLGFKKEEAVILSNCVLIPKKRLDDLIKAANIIKEKIKIKLIISGYGEQSERNRLEYLVKELGMKNDVIFTGYVEENKLINLYQAADVFVHLSAAEGGPASCKQALATNTPIVMTPVGSVGKFIQESNMGKLFPVGDIYACAEAIIQTLNLKKNNSTSDYAYKLWSWNARGKMMAEDIENVYCRIFNK